MSHILESSVESPQASLGRLIGSKSLLPEEMVLPFADFGEIVNRLLDLAGARTDRLIVAGHATPDLQIAAHHAELKVTETVGVSPFSSDIEAVLRTVMTACDSIYIANPNRVTGTSWSIGDIRRMAEAVPDGLVIVDEYYFDFYGISVAPLLESCSNLAVVRIPSAVEGHGSSDAGYLLASPAIIERIKKSESIVTSAVANQMSETLTERTRFARRLHDIHIETLRLAAELTRLGAQCRITPADYLLVRVANPNEVGNHLARYRVEVENLDGYPSLKQYIRIRVRTSSANDRTIEAFRQCSQDKISLSRDRRSIRLRRGAEEASGSLTGGSSERFERTTAYRADKQSTTRGKIVR
jgi:histidinol-phosphate/aromatic aminotransferase/cobyric acid decarboxylase-like protein